ncbi:hypothetical protein TcWFU_007723 [Taenia crassiceps]|uniref:Uncharacterized protein n=1 Tax=Taenia crassiceps TaxID=6207 RepID=A0ABR4Q0W1_9CEST
MQQHSFLTTAPVHHTVAATQCAVIGDAKFEDMGGVEGMESTESIESIHMYTVHSTERFNRQIEEHQSPCSGMRGQSDAHQYVEGSSFELSQVDYFKSVQLSMLMPAQLVGCVSSPPPRTSSPPPPPPPPPLPLPALALALPQEGIAGHR